MLHDGAVVPMSHLVIGHRDEQGRVVRYSGVMRDISEQVRSQRELERQRATLESVAQSIPAAVAVVGADQRYRFVNAAFERRVGLGKEHIVGRTVREVLGERDQLRSQPWIDRVLAGETVHFERDYEATGPAQHHAVTYVPLWTAERTTDGFVGVVQDISEQRHERKRLLQLSQLDTLTGLLNRAGLMQALDDEIAGGGGASLGLLYIDLDRFKPVNDTHGHPVGDQLLRAFGQRLREQVRPSDPVARLGGDEFVVLLKGIREAAHADAVGAKVAACARLPFAVGALRLAIGASVGVAFGVAEGQGAGELLERADAMLYRVKQAGRGTHASHWDHAL